MNVFYEESGSFKVGTILADNTTSLQVEASHGKRTKIKATSILLRFETPLISEFMSQAQKIADELDTFFLWECCASNDEFASTTLATEYFGYNPSPVEAAAVLIMLHRSPIYFYKKGRGRYKAAPAEALKAALASQEKKRHQAKLQTQYAELLSAYVLPEEFKPQLSSLLYKPDKNSVEWKALDAASTAKNTSIPKILKECGAIPSSHDYHVNQFLMEYFPEGTGFTSLDSEIELSDPFDLPTTNIAAFSIDDATTTEIDDAFSVTPLKLGSFRVGIHIAAPALGIIPQSALDQVAAQRLSTVYIPGKKITMLPEASYQSLYFSRTTTLPRIISYILM